MQQGGQEDLEAARTHARSLIFEVSQYLANVQTLPDTDRNTLVQDVNELQNSLNYDTASSILRALEELQYTYNALRETYPPVGA